MTWIVQSEFTNRDWREGVYCYEKVRFEFYDQILLQFMLVWIVQFRLDSVLSCFLVESAPWSVILFFQTTRAEVEGEDEVDDHDDDNSNADSSDTLDVEKHLILYFAEAALNKDSVFASWNSHAESLS